jgi:hypothetical protein
MRAIRVLRDHPFNEIMSSDGPIFVEAILPDVHHPTAD